jgi:hypothetical protein
LNERGKVLPQFFLQGRNGKAGNGRDACVRMCVAAG